MPPPITRVSAVLIRLAITASLSDTLAPPSTTTYGRGRVLGQPLEHLDLGLDQAAGRAGQPRGDVVHAGLLAVHHTEAVGDEDVAEGGVLVGQRSPLGVVLGLLARLVPDVLQHRDLAVGEPGDDRLRPTRPTTSPASLTSAAEQLAEPLGGRGQRVLRVRPGPWAGRGGRARSTLAPASRSWLRVGSDARIRPSSVIVSPSSGTFRSQRISTRLPRRSPRSATDFTAQSFQEVALYPED